MNNATNVLNFNSHLPIVVLHSMGAGVYPATDLQALVLTFEPVLGRSSLTNPPTLAEFGVAKGMYVHARTGWVSDRTACYLASGRPAIVQDTGLSEALETGVGLLTFSTPEEAVSAAHSVDGDWKRHARAARALAVDRFDSDRVLSRLIDQVAA